VLIEFENGIRFEAGFMDTIYREEIRIRCNRTRDQKRKAAFLEQSTAQAALREIHIGLRPN
jgi:hypothetical protein